MLVKGWRSFGSGTCGKSATRGEQNLDPHILIAGSDKSQQESFQLGPVFPLVWLSPWLGEFVEW